MRRSAALFVLRRVAPRSLHGSIAPSSAAIAASLRFQTNKERMESGYGMARSDETFLSQYDPLDVLGLNEQAQRSDVERSYAEMCAEFGPQGRKPDAKRLERVQRAFEILKDPKSIYYMRAVPREDFKHRLSYQFMDSNNKLMSKIKGFFGIVLVCIFFFGTMGMAFQPFKKIHRAALQR
jgi:hypothetical protein